MLLLFLLPFCQLQRPVLFCLWHKVFFVSYHHHSLDLLLGKMFGIHCVAYC